MSRQCPDDRTFVMRVDIDKHEHFYIDASDANTSNFTRYLNDPGPLGEGNCEFVQDDLCVQVVTRSAIAQNEELTVRYLDWHTPLGAGSESEEVVTPIAIRQRRPPAQAVSVPQAQTRPKAAVQETDREAPTRQPDLAEQRPRPELADLRAEVAMMLSQRVGTELYKQRLVGLARDHVVLTTA